MISQILTKFSLESVDESCSHAHDDPALEIKGLSDDKEPHEDGSVYTHTQFTQED